jgi:hypothetical protein
MTKWKEYTGSDEQIAEINGSAAFMLRRADGAVSYVLKPPFYPNAMDNETTIGYLICNPHPLSDMICQQARTGQTVWVRITRDSCGNKVNMVCETTIPDWNIPSAEYSLTPFEELNNGRD